MKTRRLISEVLLGVQKYILKPGFTYLKKNFTKPIESLVLTQNYLENYSQLLNFLEEKLPV
jgi:hypothetical protein